MFDSITISNNHAEELVKLSERLQTIRDDCFGVIKVPDGETVDDEKVRDNFRPLIAIEEEFNELYKRAVVPQMVELTGEELSQCVGYHLQMAEAIAMTLAQMYERTMKMMVDEANPEDLPQASEEPEIVAVEAANVID